MKKITFLMFMLLLLLVQSCEFFDPDEFDDLPPPPDEEEIPVDPVEPGTKSVYFDWENSEYLTFADGTTPVKLPWVYESIGPLPGFIRNDYTRFDGWELLYNLSDNTEANKYYFVLYNKFTGMMRVFYYLQGVSGGSNGAWGINLDKTNSLLNSTGYFTSPISNPNTENYSFSTNISIDPYHKGFGLGWNTFDTEFTYDPTASNYKTDLQLFAHNDIEFDIQLTGTYSEVSEGTIITSAKKNTLSDTKKTAVTAAGKTAASWIKDNIKKDDPSENPIIKVGASFIQGIIDGGAKEIIDAGVNLVFGSFISRYNEPSNSTSKVKMKTNGNVEMTGTSNSTNSTNIPSVYLSLFNPSDPNSVSGPHYNKKLGVWNLASSPIVKLSNKAWFSGDYQYMFYYTRSAYLDLSSINVVFNNDLLSEIDSYEVTSKLFYYDKFNGSENWRSQIDGTPDTYSYPEGKVAYEDELCKIYSYATEYIKTTTAPPGYFDPYSDDPPDEPILPDDPIADDQDVPSIYFPYINNHYVVKVTVKIYPNSNYNQDPIIISRSYLPNFVLYNE